MSVAHCVLRTHGCTMDHNLTVPSFSTGQAERDFTDCIKKKGGRIALYVSEMQCNPGHVHVKECLCSIELLAPELHLYHLPREFMSTIVITVYILSLVESVLLSSFTPWLADSRRSTLTLSWCTLV